MYRAVTWAVLQAGIDLDDGNSIGLVARSIEVGSGTDPKAPTISVDGIDVSSPIRGPQVSAAVSAVSAVPAVRQRMVSLQREVVDLAMAEGSGIIVEGRDIGTVVLPDAGLKIFLTADSTERARRRAGEQAEVDVESVRQSLQRRDDLDSGRADSPLAMANDAVLLDTTGNALAEVIDQVCALIEGADQGDTADATTAPAGDHTDIEDPGDQLVEDLLAAVREEFGDFDADLAEMHSASEQGLPVLAVVGRPNVGKSTLVNRIIGRREAVVEDLPGVTRDRVAYEAEWNGRRFQVLDTGGWDARSRGMAARIAAQAERAVSEADAVAFIVDATVGATDVDEEVVKVLRRSGKPVILVANKVDGTAAELEASALWSLGLGEPHCVSALHGRGSGDLLDAIVAVLPEQGHGQSRDSGPNRVALVGRPNVGKSSLLNCLAEADRVVVDEVAGTTVDPVDELVFLDGQWWWFVDTAGVRRKVRQASGHEFYASLRTQSALDRAEVAIVLIDASEPLSEQDVRIIHMVIESGRALVLACNKWDLVDEDRRHYLERELSRDLVQIPWVPRVNVSARTRRHVDRLAPALRTALQGWQTRVPTARLNQFLGQLAAAHPHPLRGGRQPRILFGTQVGVGPPTFALFTTGFLDAGYRRFIERRLREEFGFEGSPIRVLMRIRQRSPRR